MTVIMVHGYGEVVGLSYKTRLMKTLRICLMILLSGYSHILTAQTQAGFFSGLNIAYLETENVQTNAQQFSFSIPAGAVISKTLSRWYGLQAEISYVRMGERIDGMQQLSKQMLATAGMPSDACAYGSFKNNINLHYLQVPVLVKATIRVHPSVTYYALFGPAVSVLVSARSVVKGSSLLYADIEGKIPLSDAETNNQQSVSFNNRISIRDDFRPFTLSGIGAAGLQINRGRGSFFLEGRMTAGLSNIYRDPARQGENFTNAFACLLGYMITL
jgi:hypothetical protein